MKDSISGIEIINIKNKIARIYLAEFGLYFEILSKINIKQFKYVNKS